MPKKIIRKKVPKRPLTEKQKKQQELYEKFLKSKPNEKFLLSPRSNLKIKKHNVKDPY